MATYYPTRQDTGEPRHTSYYYSITVDRAQAVIAAIRASLPDIADEEVIDFMLQDWVEGQEHQDWLDTAPVAEIADWALLAFAHERQQQD